MRNVALIFLPLFYAAAATPPEIDSLITAARAVPGEFSAEALIRIAALDSLDRERRMELLEQSFERAAAAQQPYKRVVALTRLLGSAGFLKKLYAQDLDGLSLRLRAIEGMLPLDSRKARELFARIPALRLPRVTCDDYMVYDAVGFYDVLEKLLPDASNPERVRLLGPAAASVTSPVQLSGMARVLTTASVPDSDLASLVQSFARSMGKISDDDRSFTYSRGLGKQIAALSAECRRRKISPLPLLESYRVYLVFNLSARRCADNDLMLGGGMQVIAGRAGDAEDPQAADFAGFFNEKLRMPPLQPIREQESTPARLEGVASGIRSCEDSECQKVAGLYNQLVFGPGNQVLAPAQRNTPEWAAKFQEGLEALAGWKSSAHSTPAAFYREKSAAYLQLIGLAPADRRDPALRALLAFASQNPIQKTNRLEWFLPVNALIGRMGLDPVGFGKFADELRKSNDPVIALYARLEAMAPRSPDRIMPLL